MLMSRVANRWLNRLFKTVAILLVVFALLISILRIALPYASAYYQPIQQFLNQQFDSNVLIGKLSLDWTNKGPKIIAENVSLIQLESTDVFIQSLHVQINFWRSLSRAKIVTEDVNLIGAKVFYTSTASSSPSNENEDDTAIVTRLSTVFLEQIEQFTLFDSQVIYHNDNGNRTFLISELKWLNNGDEHRASGDVIVDGLTSNNLSVQLSLKGNEPQDMSGQLYLSAQELNITPWLDEVFAIENSKTDSSINFSAWLDIINGAVSAVQLDLEENEVSFIHNNQLQTATFSYGRVMINGLNSPNATTIYTTPLSVITNNQEWAPLTIEASLNDKNSFAYVSSINLSGLAMLYPLFSIDEKIRNRISAMAPKGVIREVFYQDKQGGINLVANFESVSTQYSDGIPGIKNLGGEIVYTPEQIYGKLSAEHGEIDYGDHFVLPIPYYELSSTINAYKNELGWTIDVNDVNVVSKELTLDAELSLFSPTDDDMQMSLLASITEGKLENAFHYYPQKVMGESLTNYLNTALVSGDVSKIQVLYNGSFTQFPFADNSGKFNVDIELSNSEFLFDSDWPSITEFDANINFTNDSMMITGRSGSLTGLDVTGVKVGIGQLSKDQVLTVEASFENTLPLSISTLMNNSPLRDSVGSTLNAFVISKAISGDFSLELPLDDTSKATAIGSVNLSNNNVALQSPAMFFTDVSGKLTYRNDDINTNDITMKWHGLPISLQVHAQNEALHYETNIAIDADWKSNEWLPFLPKDLRSYLSGSLDWHGDLLLAMHHDGDFSYRFDLASEAAKLSSNLPTPYRKDVGDSTPLTIAVNGHETSSALKAQYGDELFFNGELNHSTSQFKQAQLTLGKQPMLMPMPGFHINASLDQADITQWHPFVTDLITSLTDDTIKSAEPSLFTVPDKIQGQIHELDVFGQPFANVTFDLINKPADGSSEETSHWLMYLNAKDLRGQVKINSQGSTTALDIHTEFLHLNKPEISTESNTTLASKSLKSAIKDENEKNTDTNAETGNELKASNGENKVLVAAFVEDYATNKNIIEKMPLINFTCDDCQVNRVDLGKVSFNVTPVDNNKIALKDFVAKRGKTSMKGSGEWSFDEENKQTTTRVNTYIDADDLEHELTKLDFTSHIKDSGLKTTVDLHWQGGPQDFSINQVEGKLKARLDDGYIAKADDKGARLLSILSLESLVRKLALDFRDMFSDGVFYSEIKGDFELKHGALYTNNTKMKGTAGDLSVKGNTNISEGLLDYRLSLTPNLTSSLPVIAWIATLNPVTFLAGVALNEVITSSVVSEINYEATGPISDPEFKEVNRKTRDIRVGRSTPPEVVGEEETIIKNDEQSEG